MQNDFLVLKRGPQRRKIDISQWIDDCIARRHADLKKTKFLAITVQTVRFGIDRDSIDFFKFWEQLAKPCSGGDQALRSVTPCRFRRSRGRSSCVRNI